MLSSAAALIPSAGNLRDFQMKRFVQHISNDWCTESKRMYWNGDGANDRSSEFSQYQPDEHETIAAVYRGPCLTLITIM